MKKTTLATLCVLAGLLSRVATAADWQWSVPEGDARAYLWIPTDCSHVRGFVLANRNMLEEGVLEDPVFRQTLAELGLAEIWVVPGMGVKFDFNAGDEQKFERIVTALAEVSGYKEIATAPVIPMGHSANATWVWNFAAWKPERTLAVLSIHGDAPQTSLTGYGRENVCWDSRNIDGVPGLLVISEQEWWNARLWPAMEFLVKHPKTPLSFLCDAGNGHFNASDELVAYLSMFIRKAAAARLAEDGSLKAVDVSAGWRLDRWRPDGSGGLIAASYGSYTGNVDEAFWCFDQEMVKATQKYYEATRGKKPQLLQVGGHMGEPVTPKLELMDDGLSFRVATRFAEVVPDDRRCIEWTGQPAGTPLGHGGSPIALHWISGPAVQTGPDTFRIHFGRADYLSRGNESIWIYASHPGDASFKGAVQQAQLRVPSFGGKEQHITFPAIPNQPQGAGPIKLQAASDSGLPVSYSVREGPAVVDGETLRLTAAPPRSRYPISVTVIAWQLGRGTEPAVKRATPVEQTFQITD